MMPGNRNVIRKQGRPGTRIDNVREMQREQLQSVGQCDQNVASPNICHYSRTPLIRPPSESHWCGRIRGMVAREGFVYDRVRTLEPV